MRRLRPHFADFRQFFLDVERMYHVPLAAERDGLYHWIPRDRFVEFQGGSLRILVRVAQMAVVGGEDVLLLA